MNDSHGLKLKKIIGFLSLDRYDSHLSLKLVQYCELKRIILLQLPPFESHEEAVFVNIDIFSVFNSY
jgi:hypothetical protein